VSDEMDNEMEDFRAPYEIDRDLMIERENHLQMYREEGHAWDCHLLTGEGEARTCSLSKDQA
jgi:hypothetical protein